MAKAKNKKKKRFIIIGIIVAVIVAVIIVGNLMGGGETAVFVSTQEVSRGTVSTVISGSGTVQSNETRNYYAVTGVTVEEVLVEAGDAVSAGDLLITFNAEDIDYAVAESTLTLQSSNSDYLARIENNQDNQADYNQAVVDVANYEALIEAQEDYIEGLENGIEEERNERREAILYEIESLNIQNLSYQREMNKLTHQLEDDEIDYYNRLIMSNNMRLQQLQTESSLLDSFEATENKDELLEIARTDLADLQEQLAIAERERDAAEAAILNTNSVDAITATNDLAALQAQQRLADLEAARGGVVADFDGIVTKVMAVEGAMVAQGTLLVEVSSSEDVIVSYGASKYDLESLAIGQPVEITVTGNVYEGEIVHIDRMATTDASGATSVNVDIQIHNPDENIYLGVDGKLAITSAVSEETLLVPVEAVNTNRQGDFVYVVEDGVVHMRYVTTGISSNVEIEILSGLEEGEEVVTTITSDLAEGVAVVVMNDLMPENTQESSAEEEDAEALEENEEEAEADTESFEENEEEDTEE